MSKLMKEALNIINRQKATIEQLEKDKESFANSYAKAVARNLTIKAEAVKEVLEELKERIGFNASLVEVYEHIDNLIEEKAGNINEIV